MTIDTSRIPANMTPGEYLIKLDEPRERPRRQMDYPPDHTRRDWLLYENEQERRAKPYSPDFAWHLRGLLVLAKHDAKHKSRIEELFRVEGRLACVTGQDVLTFLEVFNCG